MPDIPGPVHTYVPSSPGCWRAFGEVQADEARRFRHPGAHALPRHQTAHGALLADIVDVLRGEPAPSAEGELLSPPEELSPSELRVLRYLPTNLTRPEIARELYVSIDTVNTHMRNICPKLGARDRSSAVRRARELRLLSTGRS